MNRNAQDRLLAVADELERALNEESTGRERAWAERVGHVLAAVDQALRQHAAEAEGPASLYTEVDLTRPSLVRQVGELRQEHARFLSHLGTLLQEVQSASQAFQRPAESGVLSGTLPAAGRTAGIPDFGGIRHELEQFLADLRRHRDEEAELVLESVTTDIGAGD